MGWEVGGGGGGGGGGGVAGKASLKKGLLHLSPFVKILLRWLDTSFHP